MKTLLLRSMFLLTLLATAGHAQNLQSAKAPNKADAQGLRQGKWLILYDKAWKVIKDKAQAEFYRIATYQHGKLMGKVTDSYKSGVPQMVADSVIDEAKNKFHGNVTYYLVDGKKENTTLYKDGQLVKDTYYNLDGTIASPSWIEINGKDARRAAVGANRSR